VLSLYSESLKAVWLLTMLCPHGDVADMMHLNHDTPRHLLYLSEQKCAAARAPAARTKDVLREAFWKVDIQRTGCVSLAQFLQVGGGGGGLRRNT
jgi:hypothetical protein